MSTKSDSHGITFRKDTNLVCQVTAYNYKYAKKMKELIK